MLLSDLASLHRASRPFAFAGAPGGDAGLSIIPPSLQGLPAFVKYNTGDVEIDRMYNQSPVIAEYASTYENDAFKSSDKEANKHPASTISTATSSFFISALDGKKVHKSEITFQPRPIVAAHNDLSELTKQLNASPSKAKDAKTAGRQRLTIYLPDTEAMVLYAPRQCTFGQLVLQILREHRERELLPALHYDAPEEYELRIHEGDGEPDRDFAALDAESLLRDFSVGDEFCLCEVEREDSDFGDASGGRAQAWRGGGAGGAQIPRNTSSVNELFSPSQFGTLSSSRSRLDSSNKLLRAAPAMRDRDEDDDEDDEREGERERERGRFFDEQDTLLLSREERDRESESDADFVNVRFPNGEELHLPFSRRTTFRDLLPLIAKTHKLRLFTDEYIFVISQQDQKHLKLMSPFIDASSKIVSVGTKVFEIQRKVYADTHAVAKKSAKSPAQAAPRSVLPVGPRGSVGDSVSGPLLSAAAAAAASATAPLSAMIASFSEATANAYQEWNVVKKNKFGRRQERVFGVDGRKVYNAKRGALKQVGGVHRAERDIDTIVKIEILADESSTPSAANQNNPTTNLTLDTAGSKTFRITWADSNDIYNIEYTTETARECLEIVAKIKFLLGRLKRQQQGAAHY